MGGPNPGSMPRRPKPAVGPAASQPRPTPATGRPTNAPRKAPAPQPPQDPAAVGLPDLFVNPYTFVPLPEDVLRSAPSGHHRAGEGNLSGSLTATFTAKSRILTRGGPDGGPPIRTGLPVIPGSSLHGALRSMHEALCGGCLRVFDRDFVPVYRDAVTSRGMEGWRLAVVTSIDGDGRPQKFTVCSQVALAKHTVLRGVEAESGMRLSVSDITESDNKRTGAKVWKDAQISAGGDGDWVLLLSDGSARQVQEVGPKGARRKETRYYAVFGKFAGGSEATGPDDDAWARFQTRAEGARDVDEALRSFTGPRPTKLRQLRETELAQQALPRADAAFTDYDGTEVVVGRRIATRPWLRAGQPIWVKIANGRVIDMKISMVWRHLGQTPAGERVPKPLLACEQWDDLCPSCQIFGSADTTGRSDDEAATQQAYRGHLRVGDLVPEGLLPGDLESLDLAPLSAPRPGSGQFYLEAGKWKLPSGEEPPLREWGSSADSPRPRRLRGRKRYWATSDPGTRSLPRWKKRTGQSEEMSSSGLAFPAGTVFTATVTFDNLTPAQVGSVIASLDPRKALGDQPGVIGSDLVFTIGGGRPFGFGACEVGVTIDWITSATARWGQVTEEPWTEQSLVGSFLAQAGLPRTTWPQLAAACQFNRVDPDLVWYPPGAPWAEVGRDAFDEGFAFWQKSEGKDLETGARPLTVLPDPASSPDQQRLEIVSGGGAR